MPAEILRSPALDHTGMDPSCPDPGHVHGWICPTCDARPSVPRPQPEPEDPLEDGSWVDDPELGAHS